MTGRSVRSHPGASGAGGAGPTMRDVVGGTANCVSVDPVAGSEELSDGACWHPANHAGQPLAVLLGGRALVLCDPAVAEPLCGRPGTGARDRLRGAGGPWG
jgi:hypothetical protein